MSQVEEFAIEKGMEDIMSLLKKGALVAQNPSNFETIPELDEADKEVIRRETTRKHPYPRAVLHWHYPLKRQMEPTDRSVLYSHSMFHRSSCTVRSFCLMLQCLFHIVFRGWDQTGSNGANLSFPDEFNIRLDDPVFGSRNQWIVGAINAGWACRDWKYLICWHSKALYRLCLGRLLAHWSIELLFGTPWCPLYLWYLLHIFCHRIWLCANLASAFRTCALNLDGYLLMARKLRSLVYFLVLEWALRHPQHRSMQLKTRQRAYEVVLWCLGSYGQVEFSSTPSQIDSWQQTAFGIFLGFCANLILYRVGNIAWRLQLASAFLPAVPLVLGIYLCPGTFHQTSADNLLRTSRISSMAHEEEPLQQGICLLLTIEKLRITSCEGLILCAQTTSRGIRCNYRFQLYRKILWAFHCPTCSPGDFGKLRRYDRPTDVRHQYHCILFFIYLRRRWLFCEVCVTRILGIWTR